VGGKGDVRVSIIEQIRRKTVEKFPEYDQACQRVARAEAEYSKAEAELKAARIAIEKYGDGPRTLRYIEQELRDLLGDEA
jgi:hypothetical protein